MPPQTDPSPGNGPCDGGLPKLFACLRAILPDLQIQPGEVLGRVDAAGIEKPLPSSAARLSVGDASYWVPWPVVSSLSVTPETLAPIFLWGGQRLVFPTMRVVYASKKETRQEYLTLDDWLVCAFSEWLYPATSSGQGVDCAATVLEQIGTRRGSLENKDILRVMGIIIRYAVDGSEKSSHLHRWTGIQKTTGIRRPKRDSWLRELGDDHSCLGIRCRQVQVLSCRVYRIRERRDGSTPSGLLKGYGVPRRASPKFQWKPSDENATGIDPFHTTEGDDIRLRLHLAAGAEVTPERTLEVPASNPHSLSPATSQIPFAGYDDPRRLLLAAKAQEQAVPLLAAESPVVVTKHRTEDPDPPGVNLRVGYMAWAGWNHEDAWVLSESAAQNLECYHRWVQTIELSALEGELQLRVAKGDLVDAGALLIDRRFEPAYLWPTLPKLAEKPEFASCIINGGVGLPLEKGEHDKAEYAGQVERIEVWDMLRGVLYEIDEAGTRQVEKTLDAVDDRIRQKYSVTVRVHFVRPRSLEVGDKLANRHGHKGIVGLILPDDRMPRWQGEHLEALIDPISVLNRGNWGQLYETIVGALPLGDGQEPHVDSSRSGEAWLAEYRRVAPEADVHGRTFVHAPPDSPWFKEAGAARRFKALVGRQFVMRLPQIASDMLSADPVSGSQQQAKAGKVKLDLRTQIALWAHGVTPRVSAESEWSDGAWELLTRLWLAAVKMDISNGGDGSPVIAVERLDLSVLPSGIKEFTPQPPKSGSRIRKQLTELEKGKLYFMKIEPRLELEKCDRVVPWETIAWFPVVSLQELEGEPNEAAQGRHRRRLAKLLEELCKAVVKRPRANDACMNWLRQLITEAIRVAVGTNSASAKKSMLEEKVLGRRISRSGRAVISPSGHPIESPRPIAAQAPSQNRLGGQALPLSLNEFVLPVAIYNAAIIDKKKKYVWLKRDPVLHRWGVLRLCCFEPTDTATIRLSASTLPAVAGDYDGDVAAVFALDGNQFKHADDVALADIVLHDFGEVSTFMPTKQYVFGLHLLTGDPRNGELLCQFEDLLGRTKAPAWPAQGLTAKDALAEWSKDAARKHREYSKADIWWTDLVDWFCFLEDYALKALAIDPGMGLGIFTDCESVLKLSVVECGAAKEELYADDTPKDGRLAEAILQGAGDPPKQRRLAEAILRGDSLSLARDREPLDPIQEVMAAAQPLKQKFGQEVRHFVLKAKTVDPKFLIAAQALTEKFSQSVLSVKSLGAGHLSFKDYERHVRNRWFDPDGYDQELPEDEPLKTLIGPIRGSSIERELDRGFPWEPAPWQKWLFAPNELLSLLHPDPQHPENMAVINLPVDDLRVSGFLATSTDP